MGCCAQGEQSSAQKMITRLKWRIDARHTIPDADADCRGGRRLYRSGFSKRAPIGCGIAGIAAQHPPPLYRINSGSMPSPRAIACIWLIRSGPKAIIFADVTAGERYGRARLAPGFRVRRLSVRS